jgi:hypothetical protein
VRGDDLLEVLDDKRVGIRELGGTVCQPALGDEVGEQAHQVNRPAFVAAKGRHFAWHGNGVSHRKVLQRNPPACSEEWMMACHLDFTTAVCMHTESRLHAAINPVGNGSRPHAALVRESKHNWLALAHAVFNGEPRTSKRIVNQRMGRQALPNARSGCQDDEIGLLQAAGHLVEIGEAGGDADDGAASLVELVELVDILAQGLADGVEIGAADALADVEDELLGFFERGAGVWLVVGDGGDLARRVNQPAQDGRALDDVPVVVHIGAGRHLVGERADVAHAADIFELAAPLELVRERDEVGRLAGLVELQHGLEDRAVGVAIEVVRPQELRDLHHRLGVNQQAAEHPGLCLDVLGQQLFDSHTVTSRADEVRAFVHQARR